MTTASPPTMPRPRSATTRRTEPAQPSPPARGQRRPGANSSERLAQGLGWFSIGLGLAEVLAPDRLSDTIGIPRRRRHRDLLLAAGVREIAAGAAILLRPRSPTRLWLRVGGDAVDLALLAAAMGSKGAARGRLAAATAVVAGVTAVDVLASRRLDREATPGPATPEAIHVTRVVTVNRSPEELYRFWRHLENLPRCMTHLASVRVLDERRSHWMAVGPGGVHVEWDAVITDDQPNARIAWRAIEGADLPNSGSVQFTPAPGDRGTEVRVELHYQPPGGAFGTTIAKLFGNEPAWQIEGDLRRLKQQLETGEVLHSDASIHRGLHPARPPEHAGTPS